MSNAAARLPLADLVKQASRPTERPQIALSVVSWNVSPTMLPYARQRMESCMRTCSTEPISADVIALQEISLDHVEWLAKRLQLLQYNVTHSVSKNRLIGELTATKHGLDIKRFEFIAFADQPAPNPSSSDQGPLYGMNIAETDWKGVPVIIVNTQLDASDDPTLRRKQFDEVITVIMDVKPDALVVVAMDSNMTCVEPDPLMPPNWFDAWESFGRREGKRWTYDSVRNASIGRILGLHPGVRMQHRLDRILFADLHRQTQCSSAGFGLLGVAPCDASQQLFASDHFGVWCKLTRTRRRYLHDALNDDDAGGSPPLVKRSLSEVIAPTVPTANPAQEADSVVIEVSPPTQARRPIQPRRRNPSPTSPGSPTDTDNVWVDEPTQPTQPTRSKQVLRDDRGDPSEYEGRSDPGEYERRRETRPERDPDEPIAIDEEIERPNGHGVGLRGRSGMADLIRKTPRQAQTRQSGLAARLRSHGDDDGRRPSRHSGKQDVPTRGPTNRRNQNDPRR